MDNASIAIAVLTRNEEKNIANCIQHHQKYCDVVLIDSGSTDDTVRIAKSLGARVLSRDWSGFSDQRNFAIESLQRDYEWLVFVDADEIFVSGIFDFMRGHLNDSDFDVIYVSQNIYLNGKRLRHAPGYPIYHPRIAKTSRTRFVQNQSGHGETIDPTRNLKSYYLDVPYEHYITSHGIEHWLLKHIGLARLESQQVKEVNKTTTNRMRLSLLVPDNLVRPFVRFTYHYIVRGGFRDGSEGLLFSVMYAWFELSKWIIRSER